MAWVIVITLLFGLLFAGPIAERGESQLTSTFFTTSVSRGFDDSWEVTACSLFWQRYPHDESLTVAQMIQNTTGDTHSYYFAIAPASYNKNFTLNAWARAYLTDGRDVDLVVHAAPFQTISVDTMYGDVTAVATVDSTDFAYVWNANITPLASRTVTSSASGTGVYSDSIRILRTSDSTGVGAGATVWLRPNDGGDNLTDLTDANGWSEFSVDADTFIVYFWATGYQMQTIPDTNRVANADTTDTVWVVATTAAAPSGAGLTPVTFNFFDGTSDSIQNVILHYKLTSRDNEAWHFDSSKVFDLSEVFEARSAASGQVTVNLVPNDSIYTTGYQVDRTEWHFWAINPETGRQILGEEGIKLNVTASASGLTWPKSF